MTEKLAKLKSLDNDKLKDVVKNYRQYGYDESIRSGAIAILAERGISEEHLDLAGNLNNHNYSLAEELFQAYKNNSLIAFRLYGIFLMSIIIVPLLEIKSPIINSFAFFLMLGSLPAFFAFLIKSLLNKNRFYKLLGEAHGAEEAATYISIGLFLYIIMYFYFLNKMKERMKEVR